MKKASTEHLVPAPAPHEPESEHAPVKTEMVKELANLRKSLKLSTADLAKKLAIPESEVERIEARAQDESFDRIYDYAHAMGATFQVVLPGK